MSPAPAPAEPVKIGVVGLGRFGRLHALTLSGLAESRLMALVGRRQASLESLPQELSGVPTWTNLEQAIDESDAEAWVVACSTASHVTVTRQLLAAGKKVLLEKPVADNLRDALSLAPLVYPDSGNLMMGHIVLLGLQQNLWVRTGSEYAWARSPRSAGSGMVIAQRGEPSTRRGVGDLEQGITASTV